MLSFLVQTGRKRIRNVLKHKSYIKKQKVEQGIEHEGKKGLIAAKNFEAQSACKCKRGCANQIDVKRQKVLFDAYYQKMQWSQKTLFIRNSVKRQPVKSKKSKNYALIALKDRNFTHNYTLIDKNGIEQQVCRDFFLNCIQVKSGRIQSALKSFNTNPEASEQRGRALPAVKSSEEVLTGIRQFIESVPKYESHYGRSNSQRKYLYYGLNMATLYNEYKNTRRQGEKIASQFVFRNVFNTDQLELQTAT